MKDTRKVENKPPTSISSERPMNPFLNERRIIVDYPGMFANIVVIGKLLLSMFKVKSLRLLQISIAGAFAVFAFIVKYVLKNLNIE